MPRAALCRRLRASVFQPCAESSAPDGRAILSTHRGSSKHLVPHTRGRARLSACRAVRERRPCRAPSPPRLGPCRHGIRHDGNRQRADARQHHASLPPSSGSRVPRAAVVAALTAARSEGFRGRVQIARAVIDKGNLIRSGSGTSDDVRRQTSARHAGRHACSLRSAASLAVRHISKARLACQMGDHDARSCQPRSDQRRSDPASNPTYRDQCGDQNMVQSRVDRQSKN